MVEEKKLLDILDGLDDFMADRGYFTRIEAAKRLGISPEKLSHWVGRKMLIFPEVINVGYISYYSPDLIRELIVDSKLVRKDMTDNMEDESGWYE